VELKLLGSDPSFSAVAVPSRITRQPTKEKPLNGMRFAVKDIYHLEGVRTSFGSRSYYNTYGPQPETAEAVTKLLDLGAVVLGKLKLTQYGAWEEPVESIDYQAPWNPRADGFQSPAGSSSGPACALAAYEWLDITLGSDSKLAHNF
jgi:Asp-tRNA(Asn)/Glu-tRNA(Gln) amidotransferase A subunit family amidase